MSGKKRGEIFSYEQRMGLIEIIKVDHTVVEDKSCDISANRKKQAAWEKISKEMSANFPERPKSSANDLRELWRRMKTKAKAMVRAKKIDLHKTGGGAADVGELGPEIMAILAIIGSGSGANT
ncbi:uncharacterized protein LOC135462614 [Liolophura sinensis]|uniref:uncharacterized protein LOC135462614 n=1 Tax=Liolophura sinensis TaxID=3198878 RepID=UPI003158490B